jgi:uncharacterized membrane protein
MRIAAAAGAIAGVAGLLAPAEVASTFGVVLDEVGRSQTRLLGAGYIGYAVIVWLSRDIRDVAAQRAIAVGNVVSWALSLIVGVAGVVAGLAGTQFWALLVLELAFTAAWGYFAIIDRAEASAG